jgi:hypothetical protein
VERTLGVSATAIAVVERLIVQAELTGALGRILYTNNWYTLIDLASVLYQKYGVFCKAIKRSNEDNSSWVVSRGSAADEGWPKGILCRPEAGDVHSHNKYWI